jgi:hypothetical protein
MMQATDFGDLHDLAQRRRLDGPPLWCILLEREVSSGAVVVPEVACQDAPQVLFVQDDNMVQPLAPNRANEPFREGGGGVLGEVEVDNAAAMVSEYDEDEQDAQARGGHGEEVDGDEVVDMVGEETRKGRSRSKWSARVIIELGLWPDQERQINHLLGGRDFGGAGV